MSLYNLRVSSQEFRLKLTVHANVAEEAVLVILKKPPV